MSPNSIAIRRVAETDAAAIGALAAELGYPATVDQIRARLRVLATLPMHFVVLAIHRDRPAGWIHAEQRLSLESGPSAEIVGLVVGTAARRLGVGRALVEAAVEWARDAGMPRLVVRSNIVRPESHDFYPAVGFARSKTQHVYVKELDRGQA